MKYRMLIVLPLAAAAIYLAFAGKYGGDFDTYEVMAVKCAAFIGCFIATNSLRRDYLGVAWFFTGLCMLLLFVSDLIKLPFIQLGAKDRIINIIVLVANLASVVGSYMLARAWRVAGVEPDMSRGAQLAIIIGGVVIALAIGSPAAYLDVRAVITDQPDAWMTLFSDVGDILVLCLVAPVLLTALALRGGLLGWPWGLITTSSVTWLIYDVLDAIWEFNTQQGTLVVPALEPLRVSSEAFRTMGCIFTFVAGLAQAWVVRAARKTSGRAPSVAGG